MNPIIFNCVLLYITVILLSLFQSRFRLIKDSPVGYFLMMLFVPVLIFFKAVSKGVDTWGSITGVEILAYTLMISYMNAKRIVPKINEAYIFAYTLFHWYLLIDTCNVTNWNFWSIAVLIISIYPTMLIIKSAFEHRVVSKRHKIILYYWFLFTVIFTYIDQVALDIVKPLLELDEISGLNLTLVFVSALQLYFISTMLTLAFVAVPFFHLDRSQRNFKAGWKEAMKDWRQILNYKLANYIDYQISIAEVAIISIVSLGLFCIDATHDVRQALILVYTFVFPIVFFYFKWSPSKNIEDTTETISQSEH